jgi:hypothetical protein
MSANKSSTVDKSVLCSNRMFNFVDIYLYAPEKLPESLLHSYDKFSMLISITCQKPKQDFLSWFSHYLYFTSLYFFAKITINILHHISTFLIRSVDSSFQSQSSNRIDIFTNYLLKCHWTVSIQFLDTINVQTDLWERIIYRLIYIIKLMIIFDALFEYGVR